MKDNELKIMVPNGWNFTVEKNSVGSRVIKIVPATNEDTTRHHQEDIFKLVRASELSLSDDFMKYIPKTPKERQFKKWVEAVIKAGVQDFYRPTIDPSIDGEGRICYQAGMMPAVGKSYNWWCEHAEMYCSERKSRLGTLYEYFAFLAVFIKEAPTYGKTIEWAWNSVCNDSKELGRYWDSIDVKNVLEDTGNREVCGWCDLANTCKILKDDKLPRHFYLAGGYCMSDGDYRPLAYLLDGYNRDYSYAFSTGWIVLY